MGDEETMKMLAGKNLRIMVGGQVVGMAKEAKFSIAEDEASTKEFSDPCRTPDIKQSWDITGNVMVRDAGDVLRDLLNGKEKWDVTIERKLPRLPRKMKKAHRSDYHRDTKWKRKVANLIRRYRHTLPACEVVITQEQYDRAWLQGCPRTPKTTDTPASCHDCQHWQEGDDGPQCEYPDMPPCRE